MDNGNDLKLFRVANGMSQGDFGNLFGKSQKQISNMEIGDSPIPDDMMEKLRQMGYKGPAAIPKPVQKGRLDVSAILDETHKVVAEMRKLGLKEKGPEVEREIQKRTAQEIQNAYALGTYKSAAEFAAYLWSLRQVLK